jgi:hypothetical protein
MTSYLDTVGGIRACVEVIIALALSVVERRVGVAAQALCCPRTRARRASIMAAKWLAVGRVWIWAIPTVAGTGRGRWAAHRRIQVAGLAHLRSGTFTGCTGHMAVRGHTVASVIRWHIPRRALARIWNATLNLRVVVARKAASLCSVSARLAGVVTWEALCRVGTSEVALITGAVAWRRAKQTRIVHTCQAGVLSEPIAGLARPMTGGSDAVSGVR